MYTDEWKNFLTRINRDENAADSELFGNPNDILELRLWASYRGQTLARTGLLSSKPLCILHMVYYLIGSCLLSLDPVFYTKTFFYLNL
jgi:hypothetical protein